MLLRNELTY
jgi:hypothetical protein